ncbi:MAG: M1 family metallopeptidase [Melioribacteraceae bacterium]|nr:M1 family metallopeptidase [Melioribacteraceae bacterium]
MKKFLYIPLIFILAAFLYLIEEDNTITSQKFSSEKFYENGLLIKEKNNYLQIANYDFEVDFIESERKIFVKEKLLWNNLTSHKTNELHFHLYANAYKSNNTLFAKVYYLKPENKTEVEIKKILVDGKEKNLIYFQPDIYNPNDSTVAKIILDRNVNPNESIEIYFEYELKIPISVKRFGAARGRNFFFISQWFPKIGVFENGKWICSQYHPYLNFYSDFGNYSAKIKVPKNFVVASTGVTKEEKTEGNSKHYFITQNGVHDFAWLTTDEIIKREETYSRKDGSQIQILAYLQPERERYFERYFNAVKNSLTFFEENIGEYPYQTVSLIDVPRTSASGGMEYPTLFTVSAELFARKNTGQPEYLTVHEFSHQYFYGLLANNEVYEAWLDEGFTSYIATKIMFEYYQPILENFKVAQFVPIFGINFLSYRDIPIIYTLTDAVIPEGARAITNYYKNINLGTIADTSYKSPTRLSYVVNSYNKPELVLLTLERYLGKEKMFMILKKYFEDYKFKHPKADDFFNVVQQYSREDMNWFFDEFIKSSKTFDYRVTHLKKISNTEYEVLVERLGDGIFKTDVSLITDKNVLTKKWDGKEKWKIFTFNTLNNVLSAEVDLHRKNLLDINVANNSYTVEEKYVASLSLAARWFFWIQNALMILGSIG